MPKALALPKWKRHHAEVLGALRELALEHGPARPRYFNTELTMLGSIPVAEQRARFRRGYSFSGTSGEAAIWADLWRQSSVFEVLSQSLFFYERRVPTLDLSDWKVLSRWADRLDNWAHSDTLSGYYAHLHERFPEVVAPVLVRWARSSNPWLRRQALVSQFYYRSQRCRRIPRFEDVRSLILELLGDEHFYVRRGVGWTLRELYQAYPEPAWKLLREIAPRIPAEGWYAATEKLPPARKRALRAIRRG